MNNVFDFAAAFLHRTDIDEKVIYYKELFEKKGKDYTEIAEDVYRWWSIVDDDKINTEVLIEILDERYKLED